MRRDACNDVTADKDSVTVGGPTYSRICPLASRNMGQLLQMKEKIIKICFTTSIGGIVLTKTILM